MLIEMAPNALVGAGFESFWLGPRLSKVMTAFPNLHVNEAHNGYIEVYLNLGVIGLMSHDCDSPSRLSPLSRLFSEWIRVGRAHARGRGVRSDV